jgi:hypothetical protein
MKRWLVWTWALIAGPFWLSAAIGGPTGRLPHAIFHPVYIAFALAAVFVLVRLRSLTQSSSVVRGLALALIIAQVGQSSARSGRRSRCLRTAASMQPIPYLRKRSTSGAHG